MSEPIFYVDEFFCRVKKNNLQYSDFPNFKDSFLFFSSDNVKESFSFLDIPLNKICPGIVFIDVDLKKISGFSINNFFMSGSNFSDMWKSILKRDDLKKAAIAGCFQNYSYKGDEVFIDLKKTLELNKGFINLGNMVDQIDLGSNGVFNTIPEGWDTSAFYIHNEGNIDNFKKFLDTISPQDLKQVKAWMKIANDNKEQLFYTEAIKMVEKLNDYMSLKNALSSSVSKLKTRF